MSSLKLKYHNKNTWKSTLTSDTMQSCIQMDMKWGMSLCTVLPSL